jgi:RND family efflux transporter MFP subunit
MKLQHLLSGIFITLLLGTPLAQGAAQEEAKPLVVVAPAMKLKESAPKRYVGTVQAIKHVDIMPRVTGELLKIKFTEGSIVQKGALLYELEDTTYRARVEALQAQKEQLEAALKYASIQFNRNDRLLKSNAVAKNSYDLAQFEYSTAKARIKQLAAELMDAQNSLSYTKIYAPITGRIGKSIFAAGNLISPSAGKLTDIEMIAPIYVSFNISERILRRDFDGINEIGSKAIVKLQLADGSIYNESARVTLINNKINPGTNTITLWATFKNDKHKLIPGSFVTVLLAPEIKQPFITIVPSALIAGQNGYYVYVLDKSNKVIRRDVKTGNICNGQQIILEGLDGSELVIVDGTHKVKPGMHATPVMAHTAH